MGIAAVVLAAGESKRLGAAEQMARVGGQTLLERAVRTALEGGAGAGVCGCFRGAEDGILYGQSRQAEWFMVEVNAEATEGMASSVRVGVRAAEQRGGVAGVVSAGVRSAGGHGGASGGAGARGRAVVASAYAGRKGVPAYFPARAFTELLESGGMLEPEGCCKRRERWRCRAESWMWIRWRIWRGDTVVRSAG